MTSSSMLHILHSEINLLDVITNTSQKQTHIAAAIQYTLVNDNGAHKFNIHKQPQNIPKTASAVFLF